MQPYFPEDAVALLRFMAPQAVRQPQLPPEAVQEDSSGRVRLVTGLDFNTEDGEETSTSAQLLEADAALQAAREAVAAATAAAAAAAATLPLVAAATANEPPDELAVQQGEAEEQEQRRQQGDAPASPAPQQAASSVQHSGSTPGPAAGPPATPGGGTPGGRTPQQQQQQQAGSTPGSGVRPASRGVRPPPGFQVEPSLPEQDIAPGGQSGVPPMMP